MMSASDVVFIPRVKILNSGLLFLGLTFKKIVVGPKLGNVNEFLEYFNLPSFNPNDSKSIFNALSQGVSMFNLKIYKYNDKRLEEFHPKNIAKQWDDFLINYEI